MLVYELIVVALGCCIIILPPWALYVFILKRKMRVLEKEVSKYKGIAKERLEYIESLEKDKRKLEKNVLSMRIFLLRHIVSNKDYSFEEDTEDVQTKDT